MDRELFLEKYWQRYPAAPLSHSPKSWVWGRLFEWTTQDLSVAGNGPVQTAQWHNGTSVGGIREPISVDHFRSAVRPGDWLAMRVVDGIADEVLLLAPCLVKPSARHEPRLQDWSQFRRQVEDFFISRGFLQVSTPTLVVCPGTEPHLEPFQTTLKVGRRHETRFLPTSPELSLKKMICQGHPQIFEIKSCFRNGEISAKHQPEFWMLEWYRAFSDLSLIRSDVIELIRAVSGKANLQAQTVTMSELFQQFFAFRLTPETTRGELAELAQDKGLRLAADDSWDDVFFRLFVDFIEPNLDASQPLFVEKYPPSQAALARLTEDGWGDRFEVYWLGLEIANAYHELNDPVVQRQRAQADLAQRNRLGRTAVPLDEDFFRALESGMPPTGGIALGLERLFMAVTGANDLSGGRQFSEL